MSYDGVILTEGELLHAMQYCDSIDQLCIFLGTSEEIVVRFLKFYKDPVTEKTLHEILLEQNFGVGLEHRERELTMAQVLSVNEILRGEKPTNALRLFARRLKKAKVIKEECSNCGFKERRITDDTCPLILDFLDGDRENGHIDNLRYLCLNCYYLLVDEIENYDFALYKHLIGDRNERTAGIGDEEE